MLSPAEVKDRKEVLMEVPGFTLAGCLKSRHTDLELLKSIKSDLESHGNVKRLARLILKHEEQIPCVRLAILNTPAVPLLYRRRIAKQRGTQRTVYSMYCRAPQ